jgi:hypothetical protein
MAPTRHAGLGTVAHGSEFDPEWRLNNDQARSTPDQKPFLAFGAAPAFCPGGNLAFPRGIFDALDP